MSVSPPRRQGVFALTSASPRIDPSAIVELKVGAGADELKGTGFLISSDIVMTAAHVIGAAETVNVRALGAGDVWTAAHLVFSAPNADIALLRISDAPDR